MINDLNTKKTQATDLLLSSYLRDLPQPLSQNRAIAALRLIWLVGTNEFVAHKIPSKDDAIALFLVIIKSGSFEDQEQDVTNVE